MVWEVFYQLNIPFSLESYDDVSSDSSCSSMMIFEADTIPSSIAIDVVSLLVSDLGGESYYRKHANWQSGSPVLSK